VAAPSIGMAWPKTMAPRAKGRGIWNRSQVERRLEGAVASAYGRIAALVRLAMRIGPSPARWRGPRGPSGVMHRAPPALRSFVASAMAAPPPLSLRLRLYPLEPRILVKPKCLIARATGSPSADKEIIMAEGARRPGQWRM